MFNLKINFIVLVIALFGTIFPSLAQEKQTNIKEGASDRSPVQEITQTVNEIIKINQSFPGDQNQKERREKLRIVINPKFDFREMATRCLGVNWKGRTKEEQNEFVALFSDLLARTYLSKIESVTPGMVQIENQSLEQQKATVRTRISRGNDTFPIDYKLTNKDGSWRVYDVVIENIGLVSNYRNEFSDIIRKDGFDGLLSKLREKTAGSK